MRPPSHRMARRRAFGAPEPLDASLRGVGRHRARAVAESLDARGAASWSPDGRVARRRRESASRRFASSKSPPTRETVVQLVDSCVHESGVVS